MTVSTASSYLPGVAGTVPDLPASRYRRGDRIGAWIAWIVITICVLVIVGGNIHFSKARGHLRPGEDFDPSKIPSVELLMAGRTAVGSKVVLAALQKAQGANPGASSLTAQANADQIRDLAVTSLEKVRAAMLLGELGGKTVALAELDSMNPAAESYPMLAPDVQRLRTLYARGPDHLDAADRQALVDRHSWFGQLALSHDKPETDAARRAVLAPAKRAAIFSIVFFLILLAAFVAGLALAIIALVMLVKRRLRSAYVSTTSSPPPFPMRPYQYLPQIGMAGADFNPAAPLGYFPAPPPPPVASVPARAAAGGSPRGGPFVEAFAIYLGGQILMGLLLRLFVKAPSVAWEWVLLLYIPIPILWPRFRGISKADWKRAIGWHTGRGVLTEVGWGVTGYVAGLPIVGVGFLIATLLGKLTHAKPMHPIVFEFGKGFVPMLQIFALACIWAPIVEETMFRGALFHHLRRFGFGWRWLTSALLVSFIFAAIHPQGWTFIPVLGALAFVFAALREWRGSILTSAAAHFLNNCMMVILMAGVLG